MIKKIQEMSIASKEWLVFGIEVLVISAIIIVAISQSL